MNFSKCSQQNLKIFLVKEIQGEDPLVKIIVVEIEALFSCYLRSLHYFTMSNVLQELLRHVPGCSFIFMQNEYIQGAECYHYRNMQAIFKIFTVLISQHTLLFLGEKLRHRDKITQHVQRYPGNLF